MIVWNFVVKEDDFTLQILTFSLLSTSLYSTFVWTGMLWIQEDIQLWTAAVHHSNLWKSNCCWLLPLWLLFCLGLIALSLVLTKRFEDPKVSPGMLVIAGWGWVTQRKKWNSAGLPALLIYSFLYACPWVELSSWIIKLCFPYVNSHHPTW